MFVVNELRLADGSDLTGGETAEMLINSWRCKTVSVCSGDWVFWWRSRRCWWLHSLSCEASHWWGISAEVCEKLPRPCLPCVCSASSQAGVWIHFVPLHCVCEYRARPIVSGDKWSCTLQTCTFSTQLNGPLRSLNVHSLVRDTGGYSAANQTQRGLSGGLWGALSLTLRPATLWVVVAFKCSHWDDHYHDEKVLKVCCAYT